MSRPFEVHVSPEPLDRFVPLVGRGEVDEVHAMWRRLVASGVARTFWNVNSTPAGGGVAEMLASLLAYARGVGVDARWLVIEGEPGFFRITKRLHNALHGFLGDGSDLGEGERQVYQQVMDDNFEELAALVRRGDVIILHDPQTAGLVSPLKSLGAVVIWRSHIGTDVANAQTELGWSFLMPYLENADAYVFSRAAYRPPGIPEALTFAIPPSIDPFSTKNQDMSRENVGGILAHIGIIGGMEDGSRSFLRNDGSPGRVDRRADLTRAGPPPSWDTPLAVQVSRWDRLKDPVGVLSGFSRLVKGQSSGAPQLVLAGPTVAGVADDPEGAEALDEVVTAWRRLPHSERQHIALVCLPMADLEENAAMVNALQRHASVVIQKSLREGFGLTVTEAMWKSRPIVASRVGGIEEQIEHGRQGLLVEPTDLDQFAATLHNVLEDRGLAEELGRNAKARVERSHLHIQHLAAYGRMFLDLLGAGGADRSGPSPRAKGL